jgi:peptidoglycan/LPS O-acetylase OafA/YrhL
MVATPSPGAPPGERPEPEPGRLRYIPALDGMRGLSLPGTILTHYAIFLYGRPSAPSWLLHTGPLTLNIQMFFVLSGALITSMLVSEHVRSDAISLKTFYLRRSRRLGPALVALLPIMAVVQLFWTGHAADSPLGEHPARALIAVALFVGNWVLFAVPGGISWLGPAWTLGIEEQFYLTWPAVLRVLRRRRVSRAMVLTGFLVATGVTIGIASILIEHHGVKRSFYATPTQLPSILCGCALGYELSTNAGGRLARLVKSRIVALAGLAGMVVVSIELAGNAPFLYHGGYVLYAASACLLIGHCFVVAGNDTFVTKFFGWKPFTVVGQISYEAYLIHVIAILGVAMVLPHLHVYPMMLLDATITAVVSAAFYYLIEQPIRRKGWKAFFARLT